MAAWLFWLAAVPFLMSFELHTDDTGVEVMFLLAITFGLGCLHPRHAWMWALLVGPSIPAADLLFGTPHPGLNHRGDLAILCGVVAVLGLAGSYAGVLLRKLVSAAANPSRV